MNKYDEELETDTLQDTFDWFSKARPNPGVKDFLNQTGVHFEEVGEMIAELTAEDQETELLLIQAKNALWNLSQHLKNAAKEDLQVIVLEDEKVEAYLDALCDQIVTATGCAYVSSLSLVPALREVNRSNYSKFDEHGNPIYDDTHKVIKGPFYSKANLLPFI